MSIDGSTQANLTNQPSYEWGPNWAPDGKQLTFVSDRDGNLEIYVMSADGSNQHRLTHNTVYDAGPTWSPDGQWIAYKSFEDNDFHIYLLKPDGSAQKLLTAGANNDWRMSWSPDETHLAFSSFRDNNGEIYLIKADGTGLTRLTNEPTEDNDVAWSPDSARLAITTNRAPDALFKPWKSEIVLYDLASERITSVPGLPIGPKGSVAWSPDGSRLAWAGRTGRDGIYSTENLELWTCAAPVAASSSGKKRRSVALPARGEPRSLTHGHDLCLAAATLSDCADSTFEASIRWSADSNSVLARIGRHGSGHLIAVDLDGSAPRFLTEAGGEFSIGNLSGDGTLLAATRTDPVTLPEVGVLHIGRIGRKSAAWQPLSSFNARLLDELELSKPTEHWITAEDGARVHLWVMEPPAGAPTTKGGRRPAILEIHGGPHAQYGNVFFHEFQLLAAQGYVVVYSNPRGSKGYGRDHCAAIRGNWGDRDWVDIQAVTRFMENLRGVDPKRMGIMGGSYGGYMTNWAIAHTKVFRAAITDRCVSNLLSMGGNSDFVQVPDEYWPGANYDRPERLWDRSPIAHFKGVSTPTLIIHSEGDLRCNIEQSEEIHSALALQGVPCRFVRYPVTTSHGMSRNGPADLRVHRLDEIVAGWNRWL